MTCFSHRYHTEYCRYIASGFYQWRSLGEHGLYRSGIASVYFMQYLCTTPRSCPQKRYFFIFPSAVGLPQGYRYNRILCCVTSPYFLHLLSIYLLSLSSNLIYPEGFFVACILIVSEFTNANPCGSAVLSWTIFISKCNEWYHMTLIQPISISCIEPILKISQTEFWKKYNLD
jgi:hypothetical protein